MALTFKRKIEDFICENCGEKNIGTGYTNHCKKCLWSKHVDINPGDRAEKCCGMMKPSEVDFKGGEHSVVHKCEKCGFERKKILGKNDDFGAILDTVGK